MSEAFDQGVMLMALSPRRQRPQPMASMTLSWSRP